MQNNFNLNYLSNMIFDKEGTVMYATIDAKAIIYELDHVLINTTHN